MIGRLRGILIESNFNSCLIDVNGVGYLVAIALSTFDQLPRCGEEVCLQIVTHVREDAIVLFGFATKEEKELFEILISVSGVGGKLALSILGSMPIGAFCVAIKTNDLKVLGKISGVGKRTAERLVVELKDKLASFNEYASIDINNGKKSTLNNSDLQASQDASMALEQLGFKRENINKAIESIIQNIPENERSSENILRLAIIALQKN